MSSNYTKWAAIIPYGQRLYDEKVGIIGYYTIHCVLLVVFNKLLYANDLKQRWAKLQLYTIIYAPVVVKEYITLFNVAIMINIVSINSKTVACNTVM